jgi:hypothetical protein
MNVSPQTITIALNSNLARVTREALEAQDRAAGVDIQAGPSSLIQKHAR